MIQEKLANCNAYTAPEAPSEYAVGVKTDITSEQPNSPAK